MCINKEMEKTHDGLRICFEIPMEDNVRITFDDTKTGIKTTIGVEGVERLSQLTQTKLKEELDGYRKRIEGWFDKHGDCELLKQLCKQLEALGY